jgi:hypothetical protein
LYSPSLRVSEFVDAAGRLHGGIVEQMTAARLLVDVDGQLEAFHRTESHIWRSVAVAEDRSRSEPALVISCGGLDALFRIAERDHSDFVISGDVGRWFDVPRCCETADADALDADRTCAFFASYVEALRKGLQRLQRYGFRRLAVLSIPPPTIRSERVPAS